jgi:ribonuclease HI
LRARLSGLEGRVYVQWVPAHCSLLGDERADEEAKKAARLGPDDGAQRGRISFEVVKGLIRKQVMDLLAMFGHRRCTVMALSGAFRAL